MYVIKNLANDKYYQKLGVGTHQYTDIEHATTFSDFEKAKQKAEILHAAISPIGAQINFEVEQHRFYVLKNRNGKGYMSEVSWMAPQDKAMLFATEEDAKREASNLAAAMAKVGVDVNFKVEEV